MRLFSLILAFSLLLGAQKSSFANNLVIGNPVVNGANLEFTVAWENSWFTTLGSNNYDAVWIFIKRQSCTDNLWVHAPVNTSSAAHSVTGGLLQVDGVTDGMGVYVRRFAVGAGAVPTCTVSVALQTAPNNVDNFQIHGIEMVFAPQGSFLIGNGTNCGFTSTTIGATEENSGFNSAAYSSPSCGPGNYFSSVPAAFPVGFNAFYSMKYEISQEQYAAFLNTLTYTQQTVRMGANPSSVIGTAAMGAGGRNGLEIQTPGVVSNVPAIIACDLNNNNVYNEANDGQNIACGFLSWQDLIAYLDWAAMRPMTEFEFEKLCRGTESYFPGGEYAWGTLSLVSAVSSSLNNAGAANETSTSFGAGLCAYQPGAGPLRCGFAAGLTTRQQAGAGFYGNMELSGNVWEQCVGGISGNGTAASFTTINGNGNIGTAGFCDILTWPSNGGNGSSLRGGSYADNSTTFILVGDRNFRGGTSNNRGASVGGRGVRSL